MNWKFNHSLKGTIFVFILSLIGINKVNAQEIEMYGNPLTQSYSWGHDNTVETTPNNRKAYVIQRHNGLSLSAHSYYGGIRFYNQVSSSPYGYNGTMVMSITNGNVGINTTTPGAKLDVNGSSIFRGDLTLNNSDLTWIRKDFDYLASPRTKISPMSIRLWDHYTYPDNPAEIGRYGTVLEIYGRSSHQTGQLFFGAEDGIIRYRNAKYNSSWGNWVKLLDSEHDIESTGNMKIGGKITTSEIEVKLDVFPDFVFESDYKLKTLEEVEQYINVNKHLPDVPSEKEVKENGLNLGQSDAVLLQKIEELTLYLIEQNKTQKRLIEEVKTLKEKNSELEKDIKELKANQ
jgi:hypothetical protein